MTRAAEAGSRRERNYRQYCGLAAALDAVGERWTLLVVRELTLGPRRYSDLLADLPGIGTNLLAERLRKLCELGVVRRAESPGGGHCYELAEAGESLREPVMSLARWGVSLLGDLPAGAAVRAHWGFFAVEAMADAAALPGVRESYEFRVDDEVFHLRVADGAASAVRGPAEEPALTATTDAATFARIGAGVLTATEAAAQGTLTLTGDPGAVLRCSTVLGLS